MKLSNLKNNNLIIVTLYFIYLFATRIILEIIVGDYINALIVKDITGSFIWSLIKLLQWCLPIFIYLLIKKVDIKVYLKEKFSLNFNKWKIIGLLLVWGLLILVQYNFKLISSVTFYKFLHDIIFTAFIEEFVFRGFILDNLKISLNFHVSNSIQAFLFSINHLPFLFTLGYFTIPISLIFALMYYVVFGMINGYLTKHNNSLIPATLLHGVNNLVLSVLVVY